MEPQLQSANCDIYTTLRITLHVTEAEKRDVVDARSSPIPLDHYWKPGNTLLLWRHLQSFISRLSKTPYEELSNLAGLYNIYLDGVSSWVAEFKH